jgi:hypothetical protein
MRRAVLAGVALVLAAGLPLSALERRVWTAGYRFAPKGHVYVENVQGDIRVEGWERSEVEVTVTKTATGPGSRLDDVSVAFEFGDGALGIRTVYPGESGDPVRVDYRLRVPRETHLDRLRTVQGDVRVDNTKGLVDARTLFGNIAPVNVVGRVVAHAINGNIAVSLRALPRGDAPLELDTVNGNIGLILPAGADADLEMSTVAGKVEGRYLTVASTVPGDSTRRARLGRGGVQVRLRTVRGNIRVGEQQAQD